MKKIYTLIVGCMLMTATYTQAQKDIAALGILNPDTTMNLSATWNDTLKLLMANIGNDTLQIGDTIVVNLTIQNIPLTPIDFIMTQEINPLTGLQFLINGIDLTPFGLSNGDTIEVCYTLTCSNDINTNNNSYCFTYTIGTNTPASVWDNIGNQFNFYASNNALTLVNSVNSVNIIITNGLGQVVANESNFSNNRLSLDGLKTGIYIINVIDEKAGFRKTKKVYIK